MGGARHEPVARDPGAAQLLRRDSARILPRLHGLQGHWEHRFEPGAPLYCEVERSGLLIHLSEHYGDAAPGATIFVRIDDIGALHAELNAKQFRHAHPMIVQQAWGQVMQIDDPFGNRLRFCQS